MAQVDFQLDSDQLEIVSRRFAEQADQIEVCINDINGRLDALKGGGWVGTGADRFYDEMDTVFVPNINKMREVFQFLSEQAAQAAKNVLDAEERLRGAAGRPV
jgi:WXG100 family type VII secretion target